MKRYFEFVGGSSAKFYEVTVRSNTVTTRFGRIGTEGQVQSKVFADIETAMRHAEKVIAAKLAKGYRETVAC
jgi:predicted DNA-binding WGR domain protein